ncbi:zinc ribbon domain-containing protein [Celeribacter arenosi]|uniref:Zinc ribbon domain-containing protein n=1 Tax=Celeribacter arenosi TaxID=792649 RepID=A0ABP7KFY5_9RHOB
MKQCQSCGMAMARDPEGGGTRADGTRTQEYCSFCYRDGEFLQPRISAHQMQKRSRQQMRDQGTWAPLAWLFARQIPHLKRWDRTA